MSATGAKSLFLPPFDLSTPAGVASAVQKLRDVLEEINRRTFGDMRDLHQSIIPNIQGKLVTADMPLMDGIEFSTSGAGGIAWTAGTVTYAGTRYAIPSGSGADGFACWDEADPAKLSTAASLAAAMAGDKWPMAIRDGAAVYKARQDKLIHGGLIQADTIKGSSILAGDITAREMSIVYDGSVAGPEVPVSGSGLMMNAGKLGFYSDGAMKSYIASDGKFKFAGSSDANMIYWDGVHLYINSAMMQPTGAGLGISPSFSGLLLTGDAMGYWAAGQPTSVIYSNGHFKFSGSGANKVEWDGATLTITGSVNCTDLTAGVIKLSSVTTGKLAANAATNNGFAFSNYVELSGSDSSSMVELCRTAIAGTANGSSIVVTVLIKVKNLANSLQGFYSKVEKSTDGGATWSLVNSDHFDVMASDWPTDWRTTSSSNAFSIVNSEADGTTLTFRVTAYSSSGGIASVEHSSIQVDERKR